LPLIALKKLFGIHKIGDVGKDQMICSEYIVNKFKSRKIFLVKKPAHLATPMDIYVSDEIEIF
jgi:hypothetical protein